MIIPLWSVFALATSLSITTIPLLQEKFKTEGFSLALWIKIFVAFFMLVPAVKYGIPDQGMFYFYSFIAAMIYSVSDVVYFRSVPVIGSGLMTRLLPSSVVITSLIWLVVDPAKIKLYSFTSWKMAAFIGIFALFVFSAMHIKKCSVSWQGVKKVWPVILAACIGPIFTKLALGQANAEQGAHSYVFVLALMMSLCLIVYQLLKRPVAKNVLLSKHTIQSGFALGTVNALTGFLEAKAMQLVDNPGFVLMVFYTDALWVILIYRLIGKREDANIWAGLGIVLSAFLIILVKSL